MALVLPDRVKETTTTTGTGTITLAGAQTGFQTFAEVGDGNTTYYTIQHTNANEFEVGIGTYTSSGTTLSRDTILTSSNSDNAVNFSAGTKIVFVTIPSSAAVFEDSSNNISTAGQITVGTDPTANLQVATKQYVDNATAAAIHIHTAVRVEKEGNLTATYDNGTAGVGATLTNSGTQEALVIDGITMVVNDRVLVYEQTDQTQNGVYTVTNVGSASTNWVLTRATDADSSGENDSNALDEGSYFYVSEGNAGAGESYVCNVSGTIVFGTTNITFAQFSATPEFTAGTNIDITNRTISVTGKVANADQLDGIDSGSFLRSDAADTKSSGNLTFSDTVEAVFGADSDLRVYHAGSAINHIVGLTGASTYITGGTDLYLRGVNGEEGVTINGNGAVELFHDNAKKLETSSTGVSITGTATATTFTGNLTGDVTGNADTATAWATARSLSLSGDVTGTATGIDGSGNISVSTTIGANSVALGTDTTGNYVASLVAGAAIDLQNNSGEGATPTIDVDLSELSTSTTNGDGDFFVVVDSANAQRKLTKANINNSGFNNDAGYTTNTGTVTSVTGGNGLTGSVTTSGSLAVGAGTGIDVAADSISVDVSDFMTNGANNRVLTATGTDAMNAEANLTFDGLDLKGTGDIVSGLNSGGVAMTINDGYGNANVTWNHQNGVPEQNGNAARIEVNTDASSGAAMNFQVKSNVSSGVAVGLTTYMSMTESGISVTGDITSSSDERIKENIQPISDALSKVQQINGVSFSWKESGDPSIGVIAQNVESVIPEVVSENPQGVKSVAYGNMVGLLIEAIKEQQASIEKLEARVAELEA